jgi:cell shape-determining protein MreD
VRTAAQVLLAYAVMLVLGALWRFVPLAVMPDVVALLAGYLGLTARTLVWPSALGAVLVGYLADLLLGTPRGMLALTAGLVCLFGHLLHRRILVRGRLVVMGFAAATAVLAGLVVAALRAYLGIGLQAWSVELTALGGSGLLTGLCGPPMFRLCRLLDARFARTERERTAALEGLIP